MILRWAKWSVFTLALAALIHWAVIAYAPTFIMWRVMSAIGGRDANTVAHTERATAASRAIVKPSPDLLYCRCLFDVTRRPMKVTTAAVPDTYWSVAFYAANTDNFFVWNDRQAAGKATTIVLVGKGQTVPPQAEGTIVVSAPTPRGLILFRTLINDDAKLAEIDQARRAAKCESM